VSSKDFIGGALQSAAGPHFPDSISVAYFSSHSTTFGSDSGLLCLELQLDILLRIVTEGSHGTSDGFDR
jgi:hypothetical protein